MKNTLIFFLGCGMIVLGGLWYSCLNECQELKEILEAKNVAMQELDEAYTWDLLLVPMEATARLGDTLKIFAAPIVKRKRDEKLSIEVHAAHGLGANARMLQDYSICEFPVDSIFPYGDKKQFITIYGELTGVGGLLHQIGRKVQVFNRNGNIELQNLD